MIAPPIDSRAATELPSPIVPGIDHRRPPVIGNISVDRLFGRYSYRVPGIAAEGLPAPADRMILLYGENGSGKTTILNLVYHLLSPSKERRHLSVVAQTPFDRFAISLSDGTTISALRSDDRLIGPFELEIVRGGTLEQRFTVDLDANGNIPSGNSNDHQRMLEELSQILAGLDIGPSYLNENREFLSDSREDDNGAALLRALTRNIANHPLDELRLLIPPGDERDQQSRSVRQRQELLLALERARDWLTVKALLGASIGSANENGIYLDIIKRLAEAKTVAEAERRHTGQDITRRLNVLGDRAAAYAAFGLGTHIPAGELASVLQATSEERRRLLVDVLDPYLDAIQARLDAWEEVYRVLVTFTQGINELLADKWIFYHASNGITFLTDESKVISPLALSSGERHLILLLCNVLLARDRSRVFIIDEPEISLNVKWQRQLLDFLLELSAGTSLQFFVATHSIEMISRHLDSLTRLVDARS